jgi:hypothetical protein
MLAVLRGFWVIIDDLGTMIAVMRGLTAAALPHLAPANARIRDCPERTDGIGNKRADGGPLGRARLPLRPGSDQISELT